MDSAFVILAIMGAAFIGIGGIVSTVFISVGGIGVFSIIPLFFVLLGACFLASFFIHLKKKSDIRNKGTRYPAKIFGYVQDTTVSVNGAYPVNLKVRYFDSNRKVKEAIIPTGFPRGSNQYAIGMTMDIFEYKGKYGWDKDSLRDETLLNECMLMDEKPVEPGKVKRIAMDCPNCGASFQATKGYSNKCPYCGSYIDA
ncbi:MAG: hypothetical protein KBT48_09325 [Firmicutes bacterium]|nr:hypothetical protein [Bacillota bacterium]